MSYQIDNIPSGIATRNIHFVKWRCSYCGSVKLRTSAANRLISEVVQLRWRPITSRRERGRFCNIFLEQSLVWKYCLKLEGCLHNFFLIGPHSDAAEPNSAPKIVTQFLEPSLVLLRRFCLNVRILRMPLNPRNHRCKYSRHSWSLVSLNDPNITTFWTLINNPHSKVNTRY